MLAPVAQAVTPHLKDEEEEEKEEEEEEEQHQILSLVSDTMAACLPTSYCDRQPPYSDFGYDTGLRLRYSHCQISKARTLGTDQHLLKTLTN